MAKPVYALVNGVWTLVGSTTAHTHTVADVTGLQAALDAKADIASPTFTGTLTADVVKITGGTPGAGKVLTSDADGDATWEAPAASGIQPTLFDAKGDLIVASAADTAARLAAGTDGQVLTADSAEATGLKWATSTISSIDALGDVSTASAIAGDGLIYSSAANTYSASTNYIAGASGVVLTSSRTGFGSPSSLPDVGGGGHRLDGNGNWVRWDFGTPTMISGFNRSGIHSSNYATSLRIDYSDDGLTWTQLETFNGLTASGGHLDFTEITHSARFWRYVLLTSSNGMDELDAFQLALTTQTPIGSSQWVPQKYPTLLENLTNVSDTAPSNGDTLIYTSSDIYWPSVTYVTGATITSNGTGFGTPSTLDLANGASHRLDGTGNWVKWDFGIAKRMSGFRRYDVHSSKYATSIKIQYSDDDSTWTDLQTFTGLQPGTCQLDFTDKSQNHRYWRYVNVTDTGSGDEMDAFHFAESVADVSTAQWTPTAYNGIAQTLLDAKGDILVASAADTATRLPAGTNGQILSADSAEATGLKWVDSPTVSTIGQFTFSRPGTVAVVTGVGRMYNPRAVDLTFLSARASVDTAPTGASIELSIIKNGAITIGTLTIAASTYTSGRQGFTETIADGDYLTINITQAGSTITGSDLVVQLEYS